MTQEANFLTTMHFEKAKSKNIIKVTWDTKLGNAAGGFSMTLETEGEEIRGLRVTQVGRHNQKELMMTHLEEMGVTENDAESRQALVDQFGVSDRWARQAIDEYLEAEK